MKIFKQKLQYFISLGISVVALLCMFFAFLVVEGLIGINGFTVSSVEGLGAWYVIANIFHILIFALLLFVVTISLLEILSATGVLDFKVTFRKVTSYILIKLAFLLIITFSILEALFLWFTILANDGYGLVFGAGVFVVLGVSLLGFLLLLFFERSGYFEDKRQDEVKQTKQDELDEDVDGDDGEEIIVEPNENE